MIFECTEHPLVWWYTLTGCLALSGVMFMVGWSMATEKWVKRCPCVKAEAEG